MTELEKVMKIAEFIDSKKAIDIIALDLGGTTIIADYFVICSAGSQPQMNAIYDAVCEGMAKENCAAERTEGIKNADWMIVDFGGVMLHIFSRKMRDFYALENLWLGAEKVNLDSVLRKDMI